ncbi:MAG: DUF2809 domain-containing protein [Massilia sp.]
MPARPTEHRHRITYVIATVGVILVGLASRKYPALFPAALGKYPGDALWALMVFAALGALAPKWPTRRLAALALGISYVVELTQLYQAGWINAVRATTPGHLVLGSAFGWVDLLAYTVGVAFGVAVEWLWRARRGLGRF